MAGDSVSFDKFDKFVQRVTAGIPDRTETIEQKEKAIKAKKKILKHPSCPEESKPVLKQEISVLEDEINSIKKEQREQSMNSSIFPKRNDLG